MHSFLASSPPRARDVTPTSSIERSVAIRFFHALTHSRARSGRAGRSEKKRKKKRRSVGRTDDSSRGRSDARSVGRARSVGPGVCVEDRARGMVVVVMVRDDDDDDDDEGHRSFVASSVFFCFFFLCVCVRVATRRVTTTARWNARWMMIDDAA